MNWRQFPIPDAIFALMGFFFGLLIMLVVAQIFIVNSYDFENIKLGIRYIIQGLNPWEGGVKQIEFYNPPFSIIYLWPILFINSKTALIIGGALLFAFAFLKRSWVALAWFATNSALWQIANGGIDMLVIGAGLLFLETGDRSHDHWYAVVLRTLGYGFLLIKPQGGIFIVMLYILMNRDWKGVALSMTIYGIVFIRYWPGWLLVIMNNPPLAQQVAPQTINGMYGNLVSIIIALLVLISRPWNYWQLGGALASILPPYGMPGVPQYLILGSVGRLSGVIIVILFSAGLAAMTWVTPPEGTQDYYRDLGQFMSIYHIGMISISLVLAFLAPFQDYSPRSKNIDVGRKLNKMFLRRKNQ